MDCPSCGTAQSRPDQRFCAKCGTNLAPVVPPTAYGDAPRITGPLFADDVPPPPPPPPMPAPVPSPMTVHAQQYAQPPVAPAVPPPGPPYPAQQPYDDRGGRRRTPVLLLALAALVAALIGAGGVVLLFGNDDPESDASAKDRASDTRTTSDATSPTTSSSDPVATQTAEPATFRCWDGGSPVTRLADCAPPTGAAGLAWVFPSAAGSTCSTDAGAQRASEAECAPVVAGAAVRFHYSEWRSRMALETYYGGNTLATISAPDGRGDLRAVRVETRDPDIGYKVAVYYADPTALWSVTIYAADEAQYAAAIDELEVRPFRQLLGEPA